jgi:hypothetical protein
LFIAAVAITGLPLTGYAKAAPLSEDDLLLLDFNLERQPLASSVTAYSFHNTAVISLAEAGAALEFPIIVNPQAATAEGWFIRPERSFKLDINEGFVEIEGKRLPLKPDEAFVYKDAIFITVETFSNWFPASLNLQRSTLTVEVTPRERLPMQERQARRKGGQQITNIGPATLPLIESPYRLLGPHAADIGLGYSIRRPDGAGKTTTGLAYSALASGDLAYMDSHIYLNGSDKEVLSQARFSLSRDNLGMPLGLRYVEIGDIVPAILPGLSYGGVERGVLIQGGGSAIGREDLIGSDIINLSGDALEGWDVELFQNGMRVGFQTIGPTGRYNFINIEPFAGENKFELVFYGPAGERRTETVTRYSGLTPDLPGSVRYQFSASQKGEQIYQGDSIANAGMSDRGSARFAGSMEIRVLPKLSLRGSLNNLMLDGDRLNFTSLGVTTAWRDITFGAEATHDPRNGTRWDGSITLPAQKKLWGFDTRFSHTQYAQSVLVDDPLALPTYELQLRSRTGLSLRGPIGDTSTLFSLFHNREPDRSSNQASVGFTRRIDRLTFGNTLSYYQFGKNSSGITAPDRLNGNFFISTRAYPLSLRGGMSYSLKPDVDALQYYLDSNLSVANDMTVNFGLTHNPATDITRYTSGLNWQLPQVTLSPRINYDSNGDYSGFIYAAFSLAPRPDSSGLIVSGRSLATSGTVAARVFLDNDESGTLSMDDEPVPDVTVRALQAFRTAKTDARGVAYMTGMSSERATDIVLSTETLPSSRMISTHAGNSVRPRPTAVKVVDFPVIPTGEIEGHVYKIQQGRRVPLAGAMVELRNATGKVLAFKISTHDGVFVFEDVPYATYTLGLGGQLLGKANQPKLVLGKARSEYTDIEIVVPEATSSLSGQSVAAPAIVKLPPTLSPLATTQPSQVAPMPDSPKPDSDLPKSTVKKPADGRVVQIAAFADIEGARAHRLKLQSLDLLQDAQIDIVSVDLGAHGLFHRVVATPRSSTADALCSGLEKRGIECFTIAP